MRSIQFIFRLGFFLACYFNSGWFIGGNSIFAQTNPAITSWLQNTNNTKGRYYLTGNSTPINTTIDANVQQVQYSTNYVYVTATGVPAFVTGPFATGPVSKALNNNYIFTKTKDGSLIFFNQGGQSFLRL